MLAPLHIRQRPPQRPPQLRQPGFNPAQLIDRMSRLQRYIFGVSIARDFCKLRQRRLRQRPHDRHHPPLVTDVLRLINRTVRKRRREILVLRSGHNPSPVNM